MDKEDALIVFEDHIRELEKIHEEEVEAQKKYIRRTNRKNREAFLVRLFLHFLSYILFYSISSMNYTNKVNSIRCLYGWNYSVLFPMMNDLVKCSVNPVVIDLFFCFPFDREILVGSTPLDLFKFYVEDLKARFHDEKKVVKEILKDRGYTIDIDSTFDKFAEIISTDKRTTALDAGNIKLTFNSVCSRTDLHVSRFLCFS